MATDASVHQGAHLRLLELYCTFLPEQAAAVRELLVEGISLHAVTSLYPLDFKHLLADFALPEGPAAFDTVLELATTYYSAEDDILETKGGGYGAAGKQYAAFRKQDSFWAAIERMRQQVPEDLRGQLSIGHIETACDSFFWYTWAFENWGALNSAAKLALSSALLHLTAWLRPKLREGFCTLPEPRSQHG